MIKKKRIVTTIGICMVGMILAMFLWLSKEYDPFIIVMTPEDANRVSFEHDVYFTWRDYTGDSRRIEREKTLYIWNGEEMGHGEKGFENALSRLRAMPRGSRVLLYPNYYISGHSDFMFFPWIQDDEKVIYKIAKDRQLTIIWSPFDHLRQVHPDVKEGWEELLAGMRARERLRLEKLSRKYSPDISEDGVFEMVKLLHFGKNNIGSIAFNPKTREMFCCFYDDKLYQWNVDSGECLHTYSLGKGLALNQVTVSPNGARAAVYSRRDYEDHGRVSIIDTSEKNIVCSVRVSDQDCDIIFSNDGKYLQLASPSSDTDRVVCDLSCQVLTGQYNEEFVADKKRVRAISTMPKESPTALAYYDPNGNELFRLDVNDYVEDCDITDDNAYIVATTSSFAELIVWRTRDQKEVYRYDLVERCRMEYDPVKNQFLIFDWGGGGTYLCALKIRK